MTGTLFCSASPVGYTMSHAFVTKRTDADDPILHGTVDTYSHGTVLTYAGTMFTHVSTAHFTSPPQKLSKTTPSLTTRAGVP